MWFSSFSEWKYFRWDSSSQALNLQLHNHVPVEFDQKMKIMDKSNIHVCV